MSTKDPLLLELEKDLGIESSLTDDEGEDRTFHDIYGELLAKEEIILVINAEDERKVRENLSVVKAKHTAKLKESNIKVPVKKLSFVRHEEAKDLPEGQIKLSVILSEPKRVRVHKIIVPEGI